MATGVALDDIFDVIDAWRKASVMPLTTKLTTAQSDRAAGVLLGMACGDALGAGYEFGPPLGADVEVVMEGGGSFGWAPGEWTDDTSMAVAIAEVTADGEDLLSEAAQDRIAARWAQWAETATDVGIQTRQVLGSATRAARRRGDEHPTAADLRAAAAALHQRTGKTAGNGSLMRTAPVALAYLDDPARSGRGRHGAQRAHPCRSGGRRSLRAVVPGHSARRPARHLRRTARRAQPPCSGTRAMSGPQRLRDAEAREPSSFTHNGWVVEALQGAWSAISRTQTPPDGAAPGFGADHLVRALEAAVRGGRDTDTVAAIAGALLGARWGASAVPARWRRRLHGWPGCGPATWCGSVCCRPVTVS